METTNIYQDGKVFRDIDFQIMLRKEKIRVLRISTKKAYKLAGLNGPRGADNMGMDYTRVTSSTPVAHIGLDDAVRMVDRDNDQIKILENEINKLRARKRNLLRMLTTLDGVEAKIFYYRVVMDETQESTAEIMGFSHRHLQRIEKQMKENLIEFEIHD
ncbi:MAG: hypothetical protein K0R00_3186 [Herbinix sp.]|nr:hypothetical protein [Herbinix sp.]